MTNAQIDERVILGSNADVSWELRDEQYGHRHLVLLVPRCEDGYDKAAEILYIGSDPVAALNVFRHPMVYAKEAR